MSQTGNRNHKKGYTLLELMVALGIISLMAFTIPSLVTGLWPGAELKSAQNQITTDLIRMRTEAKVSGQVTGLSSGEDQGTYILIPGGGPRKLKEGVEVLIGPHPDFAGQPDPDTQILFYPNGRSTGGLLQIKKGEAKVTVVVDWLTGKVETAS